MELSELVLVLFAIQISKRISKASLTVLNRCFCFVAYRITNEFQRYQMLSAHKLDQTSSPGWRKQQEKTIFLYEQLHCLYRIENAIVLDKPDLIGEYDWMLTIQPFLSNTSIKEHLNLDYTAIKRLKSVSFWQEKLRHHPLFHHWPKCVHLVEFSARLLQYHGFWF